WRGEGAGGVGTKRTRFTSRGCRGQWGGNGGRASAWVVYQPIGRPCFLIKQRFFSTLHSGEFGLFLHASPWLQSSADAADELAAAGGAGVATGEAAGVADGVAGAGAGLALADSRAAGTNESRSKLSGDAG